MDARNSVLCWGIPGKEKGHNQGNKFDGGTSSGGPVFGVSLQITI